MYSRVDWQIWYLAYVVVPCHVRRVRSQRLSRPRSKLRNWIMLVRHVLHNVDLSHALCSYLMVQVVILSLFHLLSVECSPVNLTKLRATAVSLRVRGTVSQKRPLLDTASNWFFGASANSSPKFMFFFCACNYICLYGNCMRDYWRIQQLPNMAIVVVIGK